MVRFLDGPAKAIVLELRRSPVYLRVTRKSVAGRFVWDALDQLGDTPEENETLFAYRRVADSGWAHAFMSDRRDGGGFIRRSTYCVCDPQPDQDTMRDTQRWRAWCYAEQSRDLKRSE